MRLHRNRKALSPIFATLILIAIAVIAGIIVYMFTSGYLAGFGTTGNVGQEKIAVQSGAVSGTGGTTVTILAQWISGNTPTATGLIVKDLNGNQVGVATTVGLGGTSWSKTAITTVTGTATYTTALASGGTYTVTLTTAAGGSYVSPSFVYP